MDTTQDTWFTPLTPLSFLQRSAEVFSKTAITYRERRISYTEFAVAATRLARAPAGNRPGARVNAEGIASAWGHPRCAVGGGVTRSRPWLV